MVDSTKHIIILDHVLNKHAKFSAKIVYRPAVFWGLHITSVVP